MTEQNRKWSESDIHDKIREAGIEYTDDAQALSVSTGSELSLYSEIRDLAERFEERAKALEATLEDECDGSKETRYRWKIKAGMFRSIGMEVKQRLQSWEIHQNGKDGHA